jgi:hypothetical protein
LGSFQEFQSFLWVIIIGIWFRPLRYKIFVWIRIPAFEIHFGFSYTADSPDLGSNEYIVLAWYN